MTTDATLAAKLQALEEIARACGLSRAHLACAQEKTRRGHAEHDDGETIDLWQELREELADIAGYGALCRWRGLWDWRLRCVVGLAGVAWRLLELGRPPRAHENARWEPQEAPGARAGRRAGVEVPGEGKRTAVGPSVAGDKLAGTEAA